jgi:RluA family pseudouridine synthase
MIFSTQVPLSVKNGATLAGYLAGRFTYHKHEEWETLIAQGKIALNGRIAVVTDMVQPKDSISYDAGEFDEPPADLNYRIIHEDPWLLGIDKPGNLLVHRAGRSFRNNLMFQLRFMHEPPYPDSHAVHRLDRETSGVVLVAKNGDSRAVFGRMFADGKISKGYNAIVNGAPLPQEINLPIGKAEHSAIPYKFSVHPSGKPAITRIVASHPIGDNRSLLTLEPLTGRTHQIRIHCAAIGSTIVGDKLYGMSEEEYLTWRADPGTYAPAFPIHRHALHCASLSFRHPFTNEECRIESALPEDMRKIADC